MKNQKKPLRKADLRYSKGITNESAVIDMVPMKKAVFFSRRHYGQSGNGDKLVFRG